MLVPPWIQTSAQRCQTGRKHVWSLTQFFSVDFPPSRIVGFSNNAVKVCVSCSWLCPGTSVPSTRHLMVSSFLCTSKSNTRGKSRAFWADTAPFKSPRQRWGSCWEERKRIVVNRRGDWFALQGNQLFLQKGNRKKIKLQCPDLVIAGLPTSGCGALG